MTRDELTELQARAATTPLKGRTCVVCGTRFDGAASRKQVFCSLPCTHKAQVQHGRTHMKEHNTWLGMIQRCENPRAPYYERYGGRGISMCPAWRESFAAFFADMGPCPSPQHSIDRINNDGNYEPGNCRWATKKEQARNSSAIRPVTARGETLSISEWAERTGRKSSTIVKRLRDGWPPEEAIFSDRVRFRDVAATLRKTNEELVARLRAAEADLEVLAEGIGCYACVEDCIPCQRHPRFIEIRERVLRGAP